ncbi:MAG: hypothetical protein NTV43_12165 [Methylococcales bacterium]|nr:hypothetical protein [Methylococcales bacterium]
MNVVVKITAASTFIYSLVPLNNKQQVSNLSPLFTVPCPKPDQTTQVAILALRNLLGINIAWQTENPQYLQ